jgi:SWI/SNF-related matrix-associated actin-dependent regulator 1 of chromatin subfamily A
MLLAKQEEIVQKCLAKKRVLLRAATGTGKTLMALTILERILSVNDRAMVVVPAFLINTWIAEAKKHNIKLDIGNDCWCQVYVVSYNKMLKEYPLAKGCKAVVFDECHFLGNPTTQRTSSCLKAVIHNQVDYIIGLTGTIIRKAPNNLYAILLMTLGMDLKRAYPSYDYFSQKFCYVNAARYGGALVHSYYGCKNVEILHRLMDPVYVKLEINELGIDLPAYEEHTIPCAGKLDPELEAQLQQEFDNGNGSSNATAKRANAMSKVPATIAAIKELMEADDSPIVVFSDHPDACKQIADKFTHSAVICGEVDNKKRTQIVNDFQDFKLKILCCTVGAAGVGLTLTAAHRVVFNDLPWGFVDLAQAKARVRRIGQLHICEIYYMVRDGVDANIFATVKNKERVLNATEGITPGDKPKTLRVRML